MAPPPGKKPRRRRREGGDAAAAAEADRDRDGEERSQDDDDDDEPAGGVNPAPQQQQQPPPSAAPPSTTTSTPLRIPDKLVKFIRSNRRDVLPYFRQLRANLVSDVDRYRDERDTWRERALGAEAELAAAAAALRDRERGANGKAAGAGAPGLLDDDGAGPGRGGDGDAGDNEGQEEREKGRAGEALSVSTGRRKRKGRPDDDGDGDGDGVGGRHEEEGGDEATVEKAAAGADAAAEAGDGDVARSKEGGVAVDGGMFDMALSSSSSSESSSSSSSPSASPSDEEDDDVAPSAAAPKPKPRSRRRTRGDDVVSGAGDGAGAEARRAPPPPPPSPAVPGRRILAARRLRARRLEEAGRCLDRLGVSVVSWEEVEVADNGEGEGEPHGDGQGGRHIMGDGDGGGGDVGGCERARKEAASSATGEGDGDGRGEAVGAIDDRRRGADGEAATAAPIGGAGARNHDGIGTGSSTAEKEKRREGGLRMVARRRGDADVAADLLRSLRVLCRATTATTTTTPTATPPANSPPASTSTSSATTWGPFVDAGGGDIGVVPCCFDPTSSSSSPSPGGGGDDGDVVVATAPSMEEEDDGNVVVGAEEGGVEKRPRGPPRGRRRHPHPAAEGLRLACRALAILDTWSEDRFLASSLWLSSPSASGSASATSGGGGGLGDIRGDVGDGVPGGREERVAATATLEPDHDDDDDDDNDDHNRRTTLLLGLSDRRGLVDMIVSSVEGEAAGCGCGGAWASDDRRSRLVSPSMHYIPDDDDEDDDDDHDEGGRENESSPPPPSSSSPGDGGGPESSPPQPPPLPGVGEAGRPSHPAALPPFSFRPSPQSRNRLCSLVDRCVYARLLASVYHRRGDVTSVARVLVGYVLSAGPVCNADVEDYPTLPPVLSLCVVEALLRRDDGEDGDEDGDGDGGGDVDCARSSSSWFGRILGMPPARRDDGEGRPPPPPPSSSLTLESVALSIRAAACTWRVRSRSSDARIRDVAAAEVAAYDRLLRTEAGWLGGAGRTTTHRRERFGEATMNGGGGDGEVDRSATDIVGDALTELLGVEGVENAAASLGRASSNDGGRRRSPDRVGFQKMPNPAVARARGGAIVRDALDALQLALVTSGDTQLLLTTCANVICRLEKIVLPSSDDGEEVPREELHVRSLLGVIVACCGAYQRISSIVMEDRRIRRALAFAGHRERGLASRLPRPPVMVESSPMGGGMFETCVLGKLVHLLLRGCRGCGSGDGSSSKPAVSDWALAATIARCATILGDGGLSLLVVRWVAVATACRDTCYGEQLEDTTVQNGGKHDGRTGGNDGGCRPRPPHPLHGVAAAMQTILFAGELPTVRVINLERRKDRWYDILVQAQRAELLLVRAVHRIGSDSNIMTSSSSTTSTKNGNGIELRLEQSCFGDYAYDGRGGGAVDFERAVNSTLRGNDRLSNYVESHWIPSKLVAVDKNAARAGEKGGTAVMMDPTERACALSHIASWRGLRRSLVDCHLTDKTPQNSYTGAFSRQFEISGYARGKSLLPWNRKDASSASPSPAFVILEDDAVLVDRFSERLAALLDELPRDFHFCSLGYSRPRAAPMVNFSKNLGVPTFLWYLTGYIISLEGARHLLDSLPVVGPVDSWVGVKMCSNWDVDGIITRGGGKGMSKILARLHLKNPDRGELVERLDFRCFAALVPLCSQKVGVTSSTTGKAAQVKWRDRDTDISYSGYTV